MLSCIVHRGVPRRAVVRWSLILCFRLCRAVSVSLSRIFIKAQRIRETAFNNGMTLLFNETRLNDGSTITLWSNITEIKNREIKLKQLADAVDVMPNTFMLWDRNNNLVMANQSSRADQKKLGFNIIPGASRIEMVKNGVKKGVFLPKKGQSTKDFVLERKKAFDKLIDEESSPLMQFINLVQFEGENGKEYRFRVISTDIYGNVEIKSNFEYQVEKKQ